MAPVRPAKIEADSNPLRDPRDLRLPRIAGPCGLVIFGVTGDLARKKLIDRKSTRLNSSHWE